MSAYRWVCVDSPTDCRAPMAQWGIHAVKLQVLIELHGDFVDGLPCRSFQWQDVPVFIGETQVYPPPSERSLEP